MPDPKQVLRTCVLAAASLALMGGCGLPEFGSGKEELSRTTRVRRPEPLFRHSYEEATRDRPPAPEPDLDADEPAPDLPPERPEVIDVPDLLVERVGADGPTRVGDGGAPADGDGLPALRIGATEPVQISVEGMPLYDFVNLVFGKLLQVNYTVAPELREAKDTVTLNMTEPMEPEAFHRFVTGILSDYGVFVDPAGGIARVGWTGEPKKGTELKGALHMGRRVPDVPPGSMIIQIVPLRYVGQSMISSFLREYMPGRSVRILSLGRFGAATLYGKKEAVATALEVIALLDRPALADQELMLLNLEYVAPRAFIGEIGAVLREAGVPVARNSDEPGIRMLPLDRKRAVLLVSPRPEWTRQVRYWHRQLDIPEKLEDEPGFFVYRPQNRSAKELVSVLKAVSENMFGEAESADAGSTGGAQEGGKPSFALDEGRNSIVISALPQTYERILGVLKQLDTEPKQVLIEATIAEVTLSDQLEHGVEWFLREHVDEGDNSRNMLQTLEGLGLGGAGFNYSFARFDGNVVAKLNAFTRDSVVNIISRPHLVVLDGKSASITVGTEVPTVSSEQSAGDVSGEENTASIMRNVSYRSTGTTLNVTPVVQSSGVLMLEIDQELSEAQATTTSSIDSPTILNRNVSTSLNLRSGQTVLLGGLIRENESTSNRRMPLLGKVPVLGRAFRVDSKGGDRTELIIQITPYILGSGEELEELTRLFDEERSTVRTGEMGR